jgi:hypothetical protein
MELLSADPSPTVQKLVAWKESLKHEADMVLA